MRISDWSSDVCSSDLRRHDRRHDLCHKSRSREPVRLAASSFFPPETTMRFAPLLLALALAFPVAAVHGETRMPDAPLAKAAQLREPEIGRGVGRERGCWSVWISVVAVCLNKKQNQKIYH